MSHQCLVVRSKHMEALVKEFGLIPGLIALVVTAVTWWGRT
jgi:hypothetical protein